jgi:hypothetical protein
VVFWVVVKTVNGAFELQGEGLGGLVLDIIDLEEFGFDVGFSGEVLFDSDEGQGGRVVAGQDDA